MTRKSKLDKAIAKLKKAGPKGMFVSELAQATKATPTTINRYLKKTSKKGGFKDLVKTETRGGLKFIYWRGEK